MLVLRLCSWFEGAVYKYDQRYHLNSLLLTWQIHFNTYIIVPAADDYSISLGAAAIVCGVMSGNFGGASNMPQYDRKQKMIMEGESSESRAGPFAVPWIVQLPMSAQNYADFLAESSAYLPQSLYEEMLERISLSFSGIHGVDGGVTDVSEFQSDFLYGSSLGKASGSKSIEFSTDMDPWKDHTSWTDTINADSFDSASHTDQNLTVAAPYFPSRPRQSATGKKSREQARQIRITEGVTALEELLPHSIMDGQEYVLDNVIDHIKSLQLQIKDLSKSRLGGEAVAEPLIFREGYGHYFLHQQMLSEPLEEMIGTLMRTDPVAAEWLLWEKGFALAPLEWTEKLF